MGVWGFNGPLRLVWRVVFKSMDESIESRVDPSISQEDLRQPILPRRDTWEDRRSCEHCERGCLSRDWRRWGRPWRAWQRGRRHTRPRPRTWCHPTGWEGRRTCLGRSIRPASCYCTDSGILMVRVETFWTFLPFTLSILQSFFSSQANPQYLSFQKCPGPRGQTGEWSWVLFSFWCGLNDEKSSPFFVYVVTSDVM